MAVDVSRAASIRGYFGATGTGKSSAAKAWLRARAAPRLLIFDPESEYQDHAQLVSAAELVGRVRAGIERRTFALRLVPPVSGRAATFGAFCSVALLAAELAGGCVVVVDELAEVTASGKALGGWGALVRTGRKRGIELVACSIRPAEIDKTFWSQATYLRTGRLTFGPDVARMAAVLEVPPERIRSLRDREFIERDLAGQGAASSGTIRPAGRSKTAGQGKARA